MASKKHQDFFKKHQDFFKKLQIVLFKTSSSFFQDIKELYLQCRGVHLKTSVKTTKKQPLRHAELLIIQISNHKFQITKKKHGDTENTE